LGRKKSLKIILVVEDIEEIRRQMEVLLRRRGHRVLTAASGEEAISIARKKQPNLILTDPDLPGFQALTVMVAKDEDLRSIPVAIIDINGAEADSNFKVLTDFHQLDALLESD
jgi:CheY-like chemotaxis protein